MGQALIALIICALIAMWVYAWVFAPRGHPDRLTDQAWTDRAEERCAVATELVSSIRLEVVDPQQRADDVDAVTDALAAFVTDLRADLPSDADGGDDIDKATRWLDDYEIYLQDRRRFTAGLREDQTTRFVVTAKEDRQITRVLDLFADVNGMQSCMTPSDVT